MRGHRVKTSRKSSGNVCILSSLNIISRNFCPVKMEGDIKWLEIGKNSRPAGSDLGAGGDEAFREEAERVLYNGEKELGQQR